MISKKLLSYLNVFQRFVWILSQLRAFDLKFQQETLHGQKSTVWKTAIILRYLLTRKLSIIFDYAYFSNFSRV